MNEETQRKIFHYLKKKKIENFVGVPDSTLKHFIDEGLKNKKIIIGGSANRVEIDSTIFNFFIFLSIFIFILSLLIE